MRSSFVSLLILFVLGRIGAERDNKAIWKGLSVNCINDDESTKVVNNSSVSCYVIRLVRKITQKLLEDSRKNKNIKFIHDISLVSREYQGKSSRDGRFLKNYGFFVTLVNWLQGRELRFKLRTMLPVNLENAIEQSLPSSDEEKGRKKGDGLGGGYKGNQVILMGLMMCKMMAVMGFGALGLVVMKALAVSAAALLLSLLAASKKMPADKNDEKHVVYAQEIKHGHYRRRRSLEDNKNYPYWAYVRFDN